MPTGAVIWMHVMPLMVLPGIILRPDKLNTVLLLFFTTMFIGLTSILFSQEYVTSGRIYVVLGTIALFTRLFVPIRGVTRPS